MSTYAKHISSLQLLVSYINTHHDNDTTHWWYRNLWFVHVCMYRL